MVTKYDVFEVARTYGAPIKPVNVMRELRRDKSAYKSIHRFLNELVGEGLVKKLGQKYEVKHSIKSELLYGIIQYCLKNNLNYNILLDKGLAEFIALALKKERIVASKSKLNPRTVRKYIDFLSRAGLLLTLSKKPLVIKVFYNTLINNLLVYFGYEKIDVSKTAPTYISDIKKELRTFKRLRKISERVYNKLVDDLEISFVHHSLALEGNPITLPDTFRILKDKIIPANLRSYDVDEVKNYQDAIVQMIKDATEKKELSFEGTLAYHAKAMRHEPRFAGKIRTIEVHIRGNPDFVISPAKIVRDKLENLFKEYHSFFKKEKKSIQQILGFATYFHNEFQHIHPFEDGNSRTTRLLTFHILQSHDIPLIDMPLGLLDEYMNTTKKSKDRDDRLLLRSIEKMILYNLNKINKQLG